MQEGWDWETWCGERDVVGPFGSLHDRGALESVFVAKAPPPSLTQLLQMPIYIYTGETILTVDTLQIIFNPGAFIDVIKCACADTFQSGEYPAHATSHLAYLMSLGSIPPVCRLVSSPCTFRSLRTALHPFPASRRRTRRSSLTLTTSRALSRGSATSVRWKAPSSVELRRRTAKSHPRPASLRPLRRARQVAHRRWSVHGLRCSWLACHPWSLSCSEPSRMRHSRSFG